MDGAVEGLSVMEGVFSSLERTSGKLLMGRSSERGTVLKAGSLRLARISWACAAIL